MKTLLKKKLTYVIGLALAVAVALSFIASPSAVSAQSYRPGYIPQHFVVGYNEETGRWESQRATTEYTRPSKQSVTVEIGQMAVVNFETTWGNKAANVASMVSYITKAKMAQAGLKLILFPEMSVTGYASSSDPYSEIYKMAVENAETKAGPTATLFSALAKNLNIWIIYGHTEVVPNDAIIPKLEPGNPWQGIRPNRPIAYNSVFACAPTGEVITYQKIAPTEGSWCVPGVNPVLIDARSGEYLGLGRIGLTVGYDAYSVPELGRYYAGLGANFVLNPAASSKNFVDIDGDGVRETQGWESYMRMSLESGTDRDAYTIVAANLVGSDGPRNPDGSYNYDFPGGSVILGANSTYYAGLDTSDSIRGVHNRNYAARDYFPNILPKIKTNSPGIEYNAVRFTNSTSPPTSDLDFQPELYTLWYKDLADKMRAGESLKYSFDSEKYDAAPTVGLVNMIGTWGDWETTVAEMTGFVYEAAESGVNILVFPETVLTGYGNTTPASNPSWLEGDMINDRYEGMYDQKFMQVMTAEVIVGKNPGRTVQHFKKLAQQYNMVIMIGMAELREDGESVWERSAISSVQTWTEKVYNSQAIIFPTDDPYDSLSYRKTQRAGSSSYTSEGGWSLSGDGPVVFETDYGLAAVTICRDGHWYPETTRYAAALGATMYIHPTAANGTPYYRYIRIGSYVNRDGVVGITNNLFGRDGRITLQPAVADNSGKEPGDAGYTATWGSSRNATLEEVRKLQALGIQYDLSVNTRTNNFIVYSDAAGNLTSYGTNTAGKYGYGIDGQKNFSYGDVPIGFAKYRNVVYNYAQDSSQFFTTSLIMSPYQGEYQGNAVNFNPEDGSVLDFHGTGHESAGFGEHLAATASNAYSSPYGLETATLDMSDTGFNITNFNPDLYSRMYDRLATIHVNNYQSIYAQSDAFEEKVKGLTGGITGDDDFAQLLEALAAQDTLGQDMDLVSPTLIAKLESLKQAVAESNQTVITGPQSTVSVSGVDWNAKLHASVILPDSMDHDDFTEKIDGDKNILALLELSLTDIITGDAYVFDEEIQLTITGFSGLDSGHNAYVIIRQGDTLKELSVTVVDSGTITFTTTEFSLFALTATPILAPDETPPKTPPAVWITSLVVTLAVFVGGAVLLALYMKKKRKTSDRNK